MLAPNKAGLTPIAVLGAGELISHLHRIECGADETGAEYQFNVFREKSNAEVSHALRIYDLSDLLNLCHVVAFAILDDGWIREDERTHLQGLLARLESIREDKGSSRNG